MIIRVRVAAPSDPSFSACPAGVQIELPVVDTIEEDYASRFNFYNVIKVSQVFKSIQTSYTFGPALEIEVARDELEVLHVRWSRQVLTYM